VTTALYEAGYGSSRGLYEHAAARLGMTPDAYRRGGPAVAIDYTVIDCPVGRLLLAATARGVCRVSMAGADKVLEADLKREFPAAEVRRNDAVLSDWAREVLRRTRGEPPAVELPLDVRATAFQWRVWQLLQAIPLGETKTYCEIAKELGQPTAARAVARACATNPVSILIPCHRVVRTDGGLGGYRWGLDRKRKLLDGERRAADDEA
jgi:AraC family transcriptional regulator of adaptative response/methylated-DNA-[protein]-cysteine methyltransferase